VTNLEKQDLALAAAGGLTGALVGFFVSKKTHEVVGTIAGVLVGSILLPGAVEGVKRLQSK
jgi:hypothetical protein